MVLILNVMILFFMVLVSVVVFSDECVSVMKMVGVVLGIGGVVMMIGLDKVVGYVNLLLN